MLYQNQTLALTEVVQWLFWGLQAHWKMFRVIC